MIVHFLKEDALEALRTNLHANLKHYTEPTNEWIYEYFGDENPFGEFKTAFPDFKLNFNNNLGEAENDLQNTIVLYSNMMHLTDTQASDERLWAGLCHCDFWQYLQARWSNENSKELKETNIHRRYYFTKSNLRRSLTRNSISKLWWIGRLTYDPSRRDPFEFTKYLLNDYATKTYIIFTYNYIGNRSVMIGLFDALKQLEDCKFRIRGKEKRSIYYYAKQYLNVLGANYVIDYFSSEEISEKVITHMKSLSGARFDA